MQRKAAFSLIFVLINVSFFAILQGVGASPQIANLSVTGSDVNDVSDSNCYNALLTDGGTSFSLDKNAHIDAPLQTVSDVGTINSATLYYDSWGSLSGSWGIYLKDSRDGNNIAYSDPAPEDGSEYRNSFDCSSLTPAQLNNGVWLYVINLDNKKPEKINIDYIYLSVEYTPATPSNAPTVYIVSPDNLNTTNDTTPAHTFYFVDPDDTTATCTLYYNGLLKATDSNVQNNTNTVLMASETIDGTYSWWINCTAGIDTVQSEIRTITIDTSTPSQKSVAYYYPSSDISSGWNDGDSTSYTSIDDSVTAPDLPSTNSDYLASIAGDNVISEFGFPSITVEPDYITLWVYTTTGSNALYTFYLQQAGSTRASNTIQPKTEAGWQNCTWSSPSGDYSGLTIELGGCTKSGKGKPKPSTVYAAYLEVGYTPEEPEPSNAPPAVFLVSPVNFYITNDNTPQHTFYVIDPDNLTVTSTLYYDNSIMAINSSTLNNTITSFSLSPQADGIYNWWINCSDGLNETQSETRVMTIDTTQPSITFTDKTSVTGYSNNDWIMINVSVFDIGPAGIDSVVLEWNGANESFDNIDGMYYWENKTNLPSGNYTFRAFVTDTAGNPNWTPLCWVNITSPAQISINFPFEGMYFPLNQRTILINISTDRNASCQYSTSDFNYGEGINFTYGQDTKYHSFVLDVNVGDIFTLYYRSKDTLTGVPSTSSTIHRFGVYGKKILTNSMRISVSEAYDTTLNAHQRNLLDNMPTTHYTTSASKVWSDTNTLTITFKLPDKNGYTTTNYAVSHFRFRCNNLDRAPNKYDVRADNTLILSDETITPSIADQWVIVDLPDTNLTYAGGTIKWIIKGVQGSSAQKVSISDVEIFSTENLNYVIQTEQTGYVGISRWWNNLQWAYSLHVDDVDDADYTVNKFGSVMPLTMQIWRDITPDFGNEASIINAGHEYGSHGYSHSRTADYSYASGRSWLLNSRNFIESSTTNTSRWGDSVLSLAYPYSDTNFHVSEAAYDIGFRISGQINSLTGTGTTTSWRGYFNGTNTTRDEQDWMHIFRSLGSAKTTAGQFTDGSFELRWNWTRDNGFFGDAMLHQTEDMHANYQSYVENDTTGWRCTWGEARAYYYYTQHTVVTYNSTTSNSSNKVYDIHINYENTQDQARIWNVPVTYGFNITDLGLNKAGLITYLENTLNLSNLSGNQSMGEGYYFENDILYLSIIREDGEQIILKDS
jgi:peptidoglycan/xylan/chitin deacetylase (PgdA/CDA1 family)